MSGITLPSLDTKNYYNPGQSSIHGTIHNPVPSLSDQEKVAGTLNQGVSSDRITHTNTRAIGFYRHVLAWLIPSIINNTCGIAAVCIGATGGVNCMAITSTDSLGLPTCTNTGGCFISVALGVTTFVIMIIFSTTLKAQMKCMGKIRAVDAKCGPIPCNKIRDNFMWVSLTTTGIAVFLGIAGLALGVTNLPCTKT